VTRLADAVRSSGAEGVVTTEKDAVRFEALGTLPFPLWVAPMELVCEGWGTLAACIEAAMARHGEVTSAKFKVGGTLASERVETSGTVGEGVTGQPDRAAEA
jgi:hypothetical protein